MPFWLRAAALSRPFPVDAGVILPFLFVLLLLDDRIYAKPLLDHVGALAVRRDHQGDATGKCRRRHLKGAETDTRGQHSGGDKSAHVCFLLLYSDAPGPRVPR